RDRRTSARRQVARERARIPARLSACRRRERGLMPRYKLTIEYDGSPFVGWQAQTNGASVQQVLEAGLKGFCGQDLKVYGAGRTDAGVHALGQVAHVDFEDPVAPDTLRDAVNAHMRPHPVAIIEAVEVPDSF